MESFLDKAYDLWPTTLQEIKASANVTLKFYIHLKTSYFVKQLLAVSTLPTGS